MHAYACIIVTKHHRLKSPSLLGDRCGRFRRLRPSLDRKKWRCRVTIPKSRKSTNLRDDRRTRRQNRSLRKGKGVEEESQVQERTRRGGSSEGRKGDRGRRWREGRGKGSDYEISIKTKFEKSLYGPGQIHELAFQDSALREIKKWIQKSSR